MNDPAAPKASVHAIRDIPVRVAVELGRASMPLARAVGLDPGVVVELDRGADDLVDLYVNDRCFASGVLVVVDDKWAIRIEKLHTAASAGGAA
jgi:flagellar motor switch protein FliN/FliY